MLGVNSPTVGDEAKDSEFSRMNRPFQSALERVENISAINPDFL